MHEVGGTSLVYNPSTSALCRHQFNRSECSFYYTCGRIIPSLLWLSHMNLGFSCHKTPINPIHDVIRFKYAHTVCAFRHPAEELVAYLRCWENMAAILDLYTNVCMFLSPYILNLYNNNTCWCTDCDTMLYIYCMLYTAHVQCNNIRYIYNILYTVLLCITYNTTYDNACLFQICQWLLDHKGIIGHSWLSSSCESQLVKQLLWATTITPVWTQCRLMGCISAAMA